MNRVLRLIGVFIRTSAQEELAYRANFLIALLHSLLNLLTGVAGVAVIFGQVEAIQGWDFPATLAVLGVYLTVARCATCSSAPAWTAWPGWAATCGPVGWTTPCCVR